MCFQREHRKAMNQSPYTNTMLPLRVPASTFWQCTSSCSQGIRQTMYWHPSFNLWLRHTVAVLITHHPYPLPLNPIDIKTGLCTMRAPAILRRQQKPPVNITNSLLKGLKYAHDTVGYYHLNKCHLNELFSCMNF